MTDNKKHNILSLEEAQELMKSLKSGEVIEETYSITPSNNLCILRQIKTKSGEIENEVLQTPYEGSHLQKHSHKALTFFREFETASVALEKHYLYMSIKNGEATEEEVREASMRYAEVCVRREEPTLNTKTEEELEEMSYQYLLYIRKSYIDSLKNKIDEVTKKYAISQDLAKAKYQDTPTPFTDPISELRKIERILLRFTNHDLDADIADFNLRNPDFEKRMFERTMEWDKTELGRLGNAACAIFAGDKGKLDNSHPIGMLVHGLVLLKMYSEPPFSEQKVFQFEEAGEWYQVDLDEIHIEQEIKQAMYEIFVGLGDKR